MDEQNETLQVIATRRATRNFSQREVSNETIKKLLELTNRAPSGFNLQPWHFIVVQDSIMRKLLAHVALDQRQVAEAPVTVVFAADPESWRNSHPEILKLAVEKGAISEEYARYSQRNIRNYFWLGPGGYFGLIKSFVLALRRMKLPTPRVVTSKHEAESYVRSQTMLAAATFMIAAQSLDLATSPIEGFDEQRLKTLLKIPQRMTIPIIIALGYQLEIEARPQSVRLGIDKKASLNIFGEKLR